MLVLAVNRNVFFFILITIIINNSETSRTNFEIRQFKVCNNTQGIIKYYGNLTKENGNYFLDFNMISPIPWDDNLGTTCLIESRITGNKYVEVFTIKEKSFCKSLNMYFGEFWYEIARAAGITPGVCPVPSGKYSVHHLKQDFTKISLQTFPFGRLRFTIKVINNKNINLGVACWFIEVDNIIN